MPDRTPGRVASLTEEPTMPASVIRHGWFDMQVCVPSDWTDEQVLAFVEKVDPAGTEQGWQIRHEGSEWLGGDPERNPCKDCPGHVHITLDA